MAVVGGTVAPAGAQSEPTTDAVEAFRECRERASERGRSELEATRACIPEEDELLRCLGVGRVSAAALRACVTEQLPGIAEGGEDPDPTDPPTSTTAPISTDTTAIGPGLGPIDVPGAGDGDGDGGGGVAGPVVVLVALAALAAGVVVGRALRRPAAPFPTGPGAPTPLPVPGVPAAAVPGVPALDPEVERAARERDDLVAALVDLADESRSEAVRGQIVRQLGAVGLEPIVVAPGERFDPTRHRGVHAEPAGAPEEDETVSATERPGWIDRGRVIRPPEVVVRRWDGGAS